MGGRLKPITLAAVIFFLAAAVAPLFVPSWATLFALILAKSIAVLGIILLLQAGQVSFGHAMFFATGAYAAAFWSKYVGGGAVIGAIIGAVAGGGKGAAIGAATGAGAGAVGQTVTRGHNVRLPAESLISFRLDRGLNVAGADRGTTKDGHHYHGYYRDDRF